MIDCINDDASAAGRIKLEVQELEEALAPFVAGSRETHTSSNHNEIRRLLRTRDLLKELS
jgi:hypothetical protein